MQEAKKSDTKWILKTPCARRAYIPGAPKKEHPTSVRYFISVYNELLQKIHIDVLALGIGVICAKMGDIAS